MTALNRRRGRLDRGGFDRLERATVGEIAKDYLNLDGADLRRRPSRNPFQAGSFDGRQAPSANSCDESAAVAVMRRAFRALIRAHGGMTQ